ncbi:hypothetical protein BRADI_5g10952v3 [Brachypodium distachyon]|uniref:Uncharacterized protein n=1 Tax=Brachypodium distachyon TaxID=15368 RepID=A0A0Q3E507_BRADI|nr:hypothetical protein BRADI_5g10952v3 [Brachypodium distachyon]
MSEAAFLHPRDSSTAQGCCFNQNNMVHVRFTGASSSGDQKSSEGRVLQRSSMISQKIIRIGSTWVDHKTLGRNMNMYGRINKYFMNMMGKSVMVEHQEREKCDLFRQAHWTR